MKVIFSASGFGLTRRVTDGIIDCFENGVVKSASIVSNANEFGYAIEMARKYPLLDLGVNLVLTSGSAIEKGFQTITGRNDQFLSNAELKERIDKISLTEVEGEWEAQVTRVQSLGVEVSHLDTYNHLHRIPRLLGPALRVARRHKLQLRVYDWWEVFRQGGGVKSTAEFSDDLYDHVSEETLLSIFDQYQKKESVEIMCNPGYIDAELEKMSRYCAQRETELKLLNSDWLRSTLKERGIQVISFRDL